MLARYWTCAQPKRFREFCGRVRSARGRFFVARLTGVAVQLYGKTRTPAVMAGHPSPIVILGAGRTDAGYRASGLAPRRSSIRVGRPRTSDASIPGSGMDSVAVRNWPEAEL